VQLIKENSGLHFDPTCVEVFLLEFDTNLEIRTRFADDAHAISHT
jgi:response regulator RpfG family c-di-GMP phosphodiesterase